MRQIRTVIGAVVVDPALMAAAEKLQYYGYLRREETNTAVLAIWKALPAPAMQEPFGDDAKERLPRKPQAGLCMGSTPTESGESGRKQPRASPIGPDHCEADDHRRNQLPKSETVTIAAIENGIPALVEVREIIADCRRQRS